MFDGLLQAQIQGVANQGVAYRHLVEPGQTFVEEGQVLKAQVVAALTPRPRLWAAVLASTNGATAISGLVG